MTHACSDGSDDRGAIHQNAAPSRTSNKLALAAAPTFAFMALLTSGLSGGSTEMLCSTADASPLSGMTTMYLLMTAFHAAPWLKLIRAVCHAKYPILGRV
jgi:hypothetical protein